MIKPRKNILDMTRYLPPTDFRKGMLRLDFNENTKGCSLKVVSALWKLTGENISRYPDYFGVAEKIANYVGFGINAENVMVTNGSDEAIKCIMDTYVDAVDVVVILVPTFALFRLYAQVAGAKIVEVPYAADMRFPVDDVISAINDKTKVVVIVNPNNPCGTVILKEDIVKIVDAARNSVVIIDEAYFEYYGETCADLVLRYDNVFVLRTFSKAFGLAGLRVGYLISSRQNILNILKVRSPYSVGVDACVAVSAALTDIGFISDYVTEVKNSRDRLYFGLSKIGLKCVRSFANFVLADFGVSAYYVWRELFLKNILVRRWSDDDKLKNYLRIGTGTVAETKNVLSVIESSLSKKKAFVFDVDGVLVDVSKSYRMAVKKTCEFFVGSSISFGYIQNAKNVGGCNNDWDLCWKIIDDYEVRVSRKEIVDKFQEFYMKYRVNEKWMLSLDVLAKLSLNYRLGIFSGRPRDELIYTLGKFGMEKYFPVVLAMEDASCDKAKPAPDGLNKTMELLGCSEGYYIGDTVDDMIAAKGAGIIAIGALPLQDKSNVLREKLLLSGADFVVDEVNDILKIEGVI